MKERGINKASDEEIGEYLDQGENKKETLVDIICRNIRRDIIVGDLQPGMKIMSKELAERYGTSETPVKLALNRMISEQIVENYPRQGMIIKPITLSDAEEIFDLRLMMDLYYTKEIINAVRINKSLRQDLADNIIEHEAIMNQYIGSDDVELFLQDYNHDYEFHRLYLRCSGNQKLVDMYKRINPFIYSNYISRPQSQDKDLAALEEHKAILNAIVEENEEELIRCIKHNHQQEGIQSR